MTRHMFLIEILIIAIVLGLLTGGSLIASDIVLSAEIRAITKEVTAIRHRLHQFKLQYNGLPGDLKNASFYWDKGCNTTNQAQMNGNGDQRIGFQKDADGTIESYKSWCHLSLANMTDERYSGAINDFHTTPVNGVDIPASQIKNAGYMIGFNLFIPDKNVLILGDPKQGFYTNNTVITNGVLTLTNSQAIDQKIDDGLASSGNIYAYEGHNAPLHACLKDDQYHVTSYASSHFCGLVFDVGI